jgi:hypothetical protein
VEAAAVPPSISLRQLKSRRRLKEEGEEQDVPNQGKLKKWTKLNGKFKNIISSSRSLPSKAAMALHPHSPIQQSPLNEEDHHTGMNADDETTGGDGDNKADEQDYVLSEIKPAGLKVTA